MSTNNNASALAVATILYISLLGVGLFLLLCTLFYTSNNCMIAAYSILLSGMVLACSVIIYRLFHTTNTNYAHFPSVVSLFFSLFPLVCLIGLSGYSLYLFTTYKDIINSGNVISLFTTLTRISTIMIFIEMSIFIYSTVKQSNFSSSSTFSPSFTMDRISSLLIILFALLDTFFLLYLGFTLKYFITDG